jgi:hypothetical protein
MGRTVSSAPGYAPDDEFDPRIDDFESKDRKYVHFDLPLSEAERKSLCPTRADYLGNSFWPLIGYTSEERRARKDDAGKLTFEKKERPIKFGSHRDAALLEFYAKSLSQDYEHQLGGCTFATSILAYRSGIGNNIDHSKSLFDEIRLRKNCVAIAMDISGFFDHIRHSVLYEQLKCVRNTSQLDIVDYKIFRRMTRFEWVESDHLMARLGSRYGRSGRICYPKDFRNYVRGTKPSVVMRNPHDFGIPQGTPLSGLYANISLFEFDSAMTKYVESMGGSYRRYSDDLAFLLPEAIDASKFVEQVGLKLGAVGLSASSSKTHISRFHGHGRQISSDKPFQYLGFTFDGRQTLVRQSSLNRYYSKMSAGIRAKVRAAHRQGIPSDQIFMRQLFMRYTHFGRARNFPRYVYRAAVIHNSSEMRRQVSRHMNIFKKMVKATVAAIY